MINKVINYAVVISVEFFSAHMCYQRSWKSKIQSLKQLHPHQKICKLREAEIWLHSFKHLPEEKLNSLLFLWTQCNKEFTLEVLMNKYSSEFPI